MRYSPQVSCSLKAVVSQHALHLPASPPLYSTLTEQWLIYLLLGTPAGHHLAILMKAHTHTWMCKV